MDQETLTAAKLHLEMIECQYRLDYARIDRDRVRERPTWHKPDIPYPYTRLF